MFPDLVDKGEGGKEAKERLTCIMSQTYVSGPLFLVWLVLPFLPDCSLVGEESVFDCLLSC
jgi:hypothetical protein